MSFNASHITNEDLKIKSQTRTYKYTKDNPVDGTGSNRYEIRNTSQNIYRFPHSEDGVFEQAFGIRNTLGVDLEMSISIFMDFGDETVEGATVWRGEIPSNGRIFFTSDKTAGVGESGSGIHMVHSLVELRMPYPQFALKITAKAAPTAGELKIINVRRY